MKRLGLGEHGDVLYIREGGSLYAMVYYRDYSGRRRRVRRSGPSKASARRAVLQALAEVMQCDGASEFTPSARFIVGVDAWLVSMHELVAQGRRSPSTLEVYRGTVERHLRKPLGELRIGEVTTPRLDRFLRSVASSKGPSTAKTCRTVLSGACGWLVRQGAMPNNPVRDVSPIEVEHRGAARALTEAEVWEWLGLVDADPVARRRDLPDLCRLMLASGVRVGEALALTWSDVDLDAGTVSVEHTLLRLRGRGLVPSRPKSSSSFRTLRMPPWLVDLLRARRLRLGVIGGPVFPDSKGGFRDPRNTARALRDVRTGSTLAWVHSHTFRKTLATLLDDAGRSARVVADQLGHSRVSMTQDVYMGRKAVGGAAAEVMQRFAEASDDTKAEG
ncbi:MAG: site-specific integrase [Phycicoccus sp.]